MTPIPERGSGTSPVTPSNELPLDDLASAVLARGRGIAAPASLDVGGALGRFFARVLAVPAGIALGTLGGAFTALVMLTVQGALWKKIALFFASLAGGPIFGAYLGFRYLARGSIDALPLLATTLQRFVPVVAFPKALTHHVSGLVIVTTYDDVRMVLERGDVFSVNGYNARMSAASGPFILGMDPGATYDKEQEIAAKAVGRQVAPLRDLVVGLSRALIDQAFERSRTIDVVTELAHPVQMAVVDRFYGVPNTHDEKLIPWLETMSFYLFNLWIGGPYKAAAIDAGHSLTAHLRRVVHDRAAALDQGEAPRDDVLGRMLAIVRASEDKHHAQEEFIVRTMVGLVSGATIATIGLFVGAIDRLLNLPSDERAAIRKAAQMSDDATVKKFLLEAARFFAYPPTLYRHTQSSFVFRAGTPHEATAERGSWVLTLPIFANYDERVFPKSDKFNPLREYREGEGPLLFGWAQHKCLGAHMAELLMLEMMKALFAKGVERAPGPDGKVQNGTSGVIPDGDYPARLVVRFD
jgi:cytochrome P450